MTQRPSRANTESSRPRPTWSETWEDVSGENWLTAKALIETSSALRHDAGNWLGWSEGSGRYVNDPNNPGADADGRVFHPNPTFEADRWLADVDNSGRGWSSTEWRLFRVVAALLDPDRQIPLVGILDSMGSWEKEVWSILTSWGTGGDNRHHYGRLHVVDSRPATLGAVFRDAETSGLIDHLEQPPLPDGE